MIPQSYNNPWVEQYSCLNNESIISSIVTVEPDALHAEELASIETAPDIFHKRLASCYIPTKKDLGFIRMMLGKAQAYALTNYPDPISFRKNVHLDTRCIEPASPVLLCGQAGVGKSALFYAIQRLLTAHSKRVKVEGFLGDWQLTPYRSVNMRNMHSLSEVLRSLLLSQESGGEGRGPTSSKLHEIVCRKLYREGCSLMGLDEFQFVSQGTTANSLVTKILLGSTYLGVPLFFICNYSLVNRLLSRNEEDIHRLMSHVVILEPDPPDSIDWQNLLLEYQRLGDIVLDFNLIDRRDSIWTLTAGVKRHLVNLLSLAYRLALSKGRQKTTVDDVSQAYLSITFAVQRREIELHISQSVQSHSLRKDIWCPIPRALNSDQQYQTALKNSRAAKVSLESTHSALTASERHNMGQIRDAALDTIRITTAKKQNIPTKKNKPTAEALTAAAFAFNETRTKL